MLFNVSELSKPLGFTIFASTPKLRESFFTVLSYGFAC